MQRRKSWLTLGIVGVLFGILPLVIHIQQLKALEVDNRIYGVPSLLEMYHLPKAQLLLTIAGAMLVHMAICFRGPLRHFFKKPGLAGCVAVYIMTVLGSFYFSQERALGWRGALEHFEGLPVLLSYLVVFIYFYMVTEKADVNVWLTRFVIPSSAVMYLIGLTQIAGHSVLNTPWMVRAMAWPAEIRNFSVGRAATQVIFGTLGNQNFMGSYNALLFPIVLYYYWKATEVKSRLMAGALLLLCGVSILGSSSRAGLIAVLVVSVLLGLYGGYSGVPIRKVAETSIIMGISAVAVPNLNSLSEIGDVMLFVMIFPCLWTPYLLTAFIRRKYPAVVFSKILIGTVCVGVVTVCASLVCFLIYAPRHTAPLQAMTVASDRVELNFLNDTLVLRPEPEGVNWEYGEADERGVVVAGDTAHIVLEEGVREIDVSVLPDTTNKDLYGIKIEPIGIVFMAGQHDGKKVLTLVNQYGYPVENQAAQFSPLFAGLERIGSGRGYIWSRALPLLKDRIVIGSGPDTFVSSFPQDDYIGKITIGYPYLIVDKPHNWYLQMASNSGVLHLLSVLMMMGIMFKKVLRVVNGQDVGIIIVVTASVVGYAVAGLFNDSVVSVAPLFWAFLGMGLQLTNNVSTVAIGE